MYGEKFFIQEMMLANLTTDSEFPNGIEGILLGLLFISTWLLGVFLLGKYRNRHRNEKKY